MLSPKTMKLPRRKCRENALGHGLGKDFFGYVLKSIHNKSKNWQMGLIKQLIKLLLYNKRNNQEWREKKKKKWREPGTSGSHL
jgi:hypothetical protein